MSRVGMQYAGRESTYTVIEDYGTGVVLEYNGTFYSNLDKKNNLLNSMLDRLVADGTLIDMELRQIRLDIAEVFND